RFKTLNKEVSPFLKHRVEAKYHIFIGGGTGSGKTTFLNVLSNFIPKSERIVTIEDSAELQLKSIPNLISLETRNANTQGEGEITIRDLRFGILFSCSSRSEEHTSELQSRF